MNILGIHFSLDESHEADECCVAIAYNRLKGKPDQDKNVSWLDAKMEYLKEFGGVRIIKPFYLH